MPESLPPTKPSTIASQTPEFSPPRKLPTSVNGMDQVLLIDEWPKGGFPMDAAKIMTVALEKNILKINITYQGGCQEHIFVLLAQTAFLMSNPPQGELYLSHDAHGDACTETIEKHLSFDLTLFRPTDPRMHPALLRVYAPVSGAFANEPYMPLAEWP